MDLQDLTIKEKIKLFKELYTDIASKGINGDTELAHVNSREAAVLKAMGGSGTVNEVTGLRQYEDWFGGDDDPPPQQATGTTTVRNVSDLPDYFKPYAEKLLATAEQVYDQPYKAYVDEEGNPIQRLVDPTSAEMSALSGLEQFFTKGTGEFDEEGVELREFAMPGADDLKTAKDLSATGAAQFGDMAPEDFQSKYMSPYQQAVTDIQLREAEKQAARTRNQLASQAAKTGAFGGSRAAIQDMMQRDQEARTLSDIQATGLQAAYGKGLDQFEADRAAARAGAGQLGQLTQQEQSQALTGLGALQTAGEAQRALAQQPLDLAYEEFGRQQMAPKQAIQEMSGVLRGVPVTPTTYRTTQEYQPAPTLGQQLLTAGSVAGGISAGMGKNWFGGGNAEGGLIGLANGGTAWGKVTNKPVGSSALARLIKKILSSDVEDRGEGRGAGISADIVDMSEEDETSLVTKKPVGSALQKIFSKGRDRGEGRGAGLSADISKKSGGINPRIIELMRKRKFPRAIPPSMHPHGPTQEEIINQRETLTDEDILSMEPFGIEQEVEDPNRAAEVDAGIEDTISGPGDKPPVSETFFDFDASLPFFAMAAKAQEPGSSVYKGLEAYGKTKGEQSKAAQGRALSKYYADLGKAGLLKAQGTGPESFRKYASEIMKGANYALKAFDEEMKTINESLDMPLPQKTKKIAAIQKKREEYLTTINRQLGQMQVIASGSKPAHPRYTTKRKTKVS
jgi:hypothetical protein